MPPMLRHQVPKFDSYVLLGLSMRNTYYVLFLQNIVLYCSRINIADFFHSTFVMYVCMVSSA